MTRVTISESGACYSNDEHGPDVPSAGFGQAIVSESEPVLERRKYLPTAAELIDRLSIVLLKQIFIPANRDAYVKERQAIEHDLTILGPPPGEAVTAILMVMLTNRFIWENESKAREGGNEQDKLLKLTHSVNGIRTRAKNALAHYFGERVDLKVDCLAADLDPSYGNWNVF